MELALQFEANLVASLGWPQWSLRTIAVLGFAVVCVSLFQFVWDTSSSTTEKGNKIKPSSEFRWFQLQYLSVYLTLMLADWLQGTNMYTLYSSYGVNVRLLFLTGFVSSALFGTFLGIYVDQWGRKLGCLIFCVLEIVINLIEHIPNMYALMIGRILGGLSTSLLFSAFESWMVSEHRKRGFAEELLSSTFAISSWGNGVVAIAAGILAQVASDYAGDIGPFQLAIALTALSMVVIFFWRENYGQREEKSNIFDSIASSCNVIYKSPVMLYLGLSQSFFEGAVFTFVFMWVPTLMEVNGSEPVPTGLVFCTFMLSMTFGGLLFSLLLPIFPGGVEGLCVFVYIIAAVAMLVPFYRFEFWWVFIPFLVLEAMVGMFNSCGATLRSKYYPEEMQSSIMTVFRVPLNVLVVGGTYLTDNLSLQNTFGVLAALHFLTMLLHVAHYSYSHSAVEDKKTR